MPLNIGDKNADTGMAKDIYEKVSKELECVLDSIEEENIREKLKKSWKTLSYCIADGVVRYFLRDDPPQEDYTIVPPEYAETHSSTAEDAEFWDFFTAFVDVFRQWSQDESSHWTTLKQDLKDFFDEQGQTTPTKMKGIVQ